MGLPQIFLDAMLQLRAGIGLVERKEQIAGSLRRVIKLDLDLDPDGGLAVGDDGLALDLTAALPVVYSAGEISVRSGSDATALYLVRRDAGGIILQTVNSNAATLFVGVHVQNTAAAVLNNQRWAPAIEHTAAGWNTVGSTSSAHHFFEQLCTVQGTTSTAELRFSSQRDAGSVTSRFVISSDGTVTIPGGPFTRTWGSNLRVEHTGSTLVTEDATPQQVLASIPVPDNSTVKITCTVLAREASTGDRIYATIYGVFSRFSGGSADGDFAAADMGFQSIGLITTVIELEPDGINAEVWVTGVVGKTITWGIPEIKMEVLTA